jgi:hypothetical protein
VWDDAKGRARRSPIHPHRLTFLIVNVLGGTAVLASYWHGLSSHPETRSALWGGLPAGLQPLYTVSMLLAAIGYFPFTYLLAWRVDAGRVRLPGRLGFDAFNVLYALILAPSALWMPLTFAMLAHPNPTLWLIIRVVLALVGIASVGLIAALLTLQPRPPRALHVAAIIGAIAFAVQTAVLDALVWPMYFSAP